MSGHRLSSGGRIDRDTKVNFYWDGMRRTGFAGDTVASALRQQFKRPFEAEDIFMTNGATGALQVIFNSIIDQGDEVIFISPPWFFYEGMILNAGGQPVRASIDPNSFSNDLFSFSTELVSSQL